MVTNITMMNSQKFHDVYEAVTDNSLDRRVDSDDIDYVMRRIREYYIAGTSCSIVFVGNESWGENILTGKLNRRLINNMDLLVSSCQHCYQILMDK